MGTVYATRDNLTTYAINVNAMASVPTAQQDEALEAASSRADNALRGRGKLPLLSWGTDLRRLVSLIAAYDLLVMRGFSPVAAADVNYRLRYEDAIRDLDKVQRGALHLDVQFSPDSAQTYSAPRVISGTPRGW